MSDAERMRMQQVAEDFYSGLATLQWVSWWAHVEANRQQVLDHIVSFADAYEKLVKLHAEGKGYAAGDFSEENLARVKRLVALVQAGLDTDEARGARQELHDLAEQCLRGLIVQPAACRSPGDA